MATNISTTTKDFNYRVFTGEGDKYEGHITRWQAVSAASKMLKRGQTPEIRNFDKNLGKYVIDQVAHEQLYKRSAVTANNGDVENIKQSLNELSGLALAIKKMLSARNQDEIDELKSALAAKYAECEELLGL